MDTGLSLVEQFVIEPLRSALTQLMVYAPSILGALIVLLIGGAIAKGLERVIIVTLQKLSLDRLADQVQLSTVLSRGGVRHKVSELIGTVVYWLVMLAFVMTALNVLNLMVAAELFQQVVGFLPNVIAALFILVIGIFAAAFVSATVRTAASNAGILQAHFLAQLVQTFVVLFASVAALQQLQIVFVGEVFLIILAGASLGCALAFGLGCKDMAGRWTSDFLQQLKSRKR